MKVPDPQLSDKDHTTNYEGGRKSPAVETTDRKLVPDVVPSQTPGVKVTGL